MKSLPFEQQPNESARSFAAFSLYLSMGEGRTLRAVAAKLGTRYDVARHWSVRNRWTERASAYTAHMAAVEREATEALVRAKAPGWLKRREDNREKEWQAHCELMAAARKALKRLNNPKREPTLSDVVRAFDVASKLGRLATGMATDKTEVTGQDGGPVRVEVTMALDKIYGQPLPGEIVPDSPRSLPGVIDVEEVANDQRQIDQRQRG